MVMMLLLLLLHILVWVQLLLLLLMLELMLNDVVVVVVYLTICIVVLNLVVVVVLLVVVVMVVVVVVVVVVGIGADGAHNLHPLGPIALVHGPKFVSAAAHSIRAHRLQLHAHIETLLEPTIGTSFPLRLVYMTTPIRHTRVNLFILHSPLKEALAAFTGEQAIMIATV